MTARRSTTKAKATGTKNSIENLADRYRKDASSLTTAQKRAVLEYWREAWAAMPQNGLTLAAIAWIDEQLAARAVTA